MSAWYSTEVLKRMTEQPVSQIDEDALQRAMAEAAEKRREARR